MVKEAPPYHWVDHLEHKHECFKYSETRVLIIPYQGRMVRVTVPDGTSELTPMVVSESDGVLTVIGQLNKESNGKPLGVMLVATQRGADEYEMGIWHELYPWAMKHLGLVPTTEG